jgi:hypothetical protein
MTRKQRVDIYFKKSIAAFGRVGKADRELIRLICEREVTRMLKVRESHESQS